jgi:UDP-2-acetamido-2-deoxy-ribo-hexuluronate aminotransferase
MQNLKMVDLLGQYERIKPEVDEAIGHVLQSTAFIQGPEVESFSKALADYLKVPFVIPCANGTDALQISMMALGLKPGDEVILPVHTYVATAEVIALLGLVPVFVDVDENSFNIDANLIESLITKKTKAIVPVHLYGQCADMEALLRIAEKHDIFLIEDTAQALGAEYVFSNGLRKKAGTIGTIGTTSFFPSKNLGCFGDGGAVITNDQDLATKIRMIANHGQRVKYQHDIVGVNSRLDTLQAAILKVKLKYLPDYQSRRNNVADFYDQHLGALKFLKTPKRVLYSDHVFHQYTLQIIDGYRDEFQKYLQSHGIPSMIYYPIPLHMQPAYKKDGLGTGSFPVAERLSKTVISLPIHTELTEEQLQFIVQKIKEFVP